MFSNNLDRDDIATAKAVETDLSAQTIRALENYYANSIQT
jgi:hypothetical protein